jgi:GntR family transcriptional regulator
MAEVPAPVKGVATRTGPFSIVPEWLLDRPGITHTGIALYALLGRYADRNGRSWPGIRTLAQRLQVSDRTIQRTLRDLEAAGALSVEVRTSSQGQQSNLYVLEVVTPASPPGDTTVTPPGDTADTLTRTSLNDIESPSDSRVTPLTVEPEPPPKDRSVGRQRALIPVLAQTVGLDLKAATTSERSDLARTAKELATVNATTEQVRSFAAWWHQTYPRATLTHRTFRQHWGEAAFVDAYQHTENGGSVDLGGLPLHPYLYGENGEAL